MATSKLADSKRAPTKATIAARSKKPASTTARSRKPGTDSAQSKKAAKPATPVARSQKPGSTSTRSAKRTRSPIAGPKPTSIDDYLARFADDDQRALLEALRLKIRKAAPRAEECISYSMPAFRLDGHVIAGFAATTRGGSYYPFSGRTLSTLASELEGFGGTQSAVHFTHAKPLPAALVIKLVRARIAETKS